MRNINAQTLAQLEATELRAFFLLDVTIDSTTVYYTDADVPIVPDANYQPRGFSIGSINYSVSGIVDQVQISIDSVDKTIFSLLLAGSPQGDDVKIRLVTVDATGAIIGEPVTVFEGEIDSWSGNEQNVSITVTNIFVRWSQRTISKHPFKCRWKVFAGTLTTLELKQASECAYEGGETTCDRSHARCVELDNTDNFGGFRFLPSIMNAEVWWGRKRPVAPVTVEIPNRFDTPTPGPDEGPPNFDPADPIQPGNEGPVVT